eukprot:3915557-Rhodomonas_salina.2
MPALPPFPAATLHTAAINSCNADIFGSVYTGYKPIPWAIKQQYLQVRKALGHAATPCCTGVGCSRFVLSATFQFRPTLRSDELKEPEPVNKPAGYLARICAVFNPNSRFTQLYIFHAMLSRCVESARTRQDIWRLLKYQQEI